MKGTQAVLAHEARDAMLAARLSGLTQVQEDAGRAVDPLTRDEGRPDQTQQPGILLGTIREGLLEPLVVATRGHVEHATQRLHAVLDAMRLDDWYVERTRPALKRVDIGIALRRYPDASSCPLKPGNFNPWCEVGAGPPSSCTRRVTDSRPGPRGELAVATDEEGEEPKQVEQEGDHRAGILSGSRLRGPTI
jgi:hypothetical protein